MYRTKWRECIQTQSLKFTTTKNLEKGAEVMMGTYQTNCVWHLKYRGGMNLLSLRWPLGYTSPWALNTYRVLGICVLYTQKTQKGAASVRVNMVCVCGGGEMRTITYGYNFVPAFVLTSAIVKIELIIVFSSSTDRQFKRGSLSESDHSRSKELLMWAVLV